VRGAFRQNLSLNAGGRKRGCMARTEKDKMLAGELYDPSGPEIQADLAATHGWLARYNAALDMEQRAAGRWSAHGSGNSLG
jgi:Maltose acetyltransferase